MQRNQLSDMSIFVEVARANGFRAAAKNLKLGAGSVSEAVQRFEDRLGVRLFDRTTRKIALTTLGQQLYQRSLPAIIDLESAVRELHDARGVIAGTLKLNAPRSSGPFFLDALIAKFCIAHPDVNVELTYDDEKVDLISSGIDAAIRSQNLLEMDTHAVSIGPDLHMAVVASQDYLNRYGTPQKPEDLLTHDGICFAIGNARQLAPWVFENADGEYSVAPKPRMVVNDLVSMMDYAIAGLGLAYTYAAPVQRLIESGQLKAVLEGMVPSRQRYTINYLSKRHMPVRLRAFIDMAKTIK